MSLPAGVRNYMLKALGGNPSVVGKLLLGISPDDPIWEIHPDSDRFSLREIVAHLADWDPIFLGRMNRTLHEDHPTLLDIDEGEAAIRNDYAHSDPLAGIQHFQEARLQTIQFSNSLKESDWSRSALKEPLGELTIEQHHMLILSHDGYHLQQIVQWLKAGGR